jgi:hypothetical protein
MGGRQHIQRIRAARPVIGRHIGAVGCVRLYGQMKYILDGFRCSTYRRRIADITANDLQTRVRLIQVFQRARAQIVKNAHSLTVCQQSVHQVRTNKPGSASH